ncbi:MAG: cyclic-di-AMP receptor [Candidatus Dormibacteria bacterium]
MKMVVAIMHGDDAGASIEALADRGIPSTRLDTSGGFLHKGNTTVLCGVADGQVDTVMAVLREHSKSRTEFLNPMPPIVEPGDMYVPYPVEVEVGGAVVFVLDVERFEKI